jgi:hypothetical protein
MQQAIVLEADRVTPSRLEVAAVGWAGQLPKLDMVHLLQQASFTLQGVTLQPSWEVLRWPTAVGDWLASKLPVSQQSAAVRAYASKLSHLFGFMRQQAIGVPTGPHAAFKEYMVDAATAKLYGPGKVRSKGGQETQCRDGIGSITGCLLDTGSVPAPSCCRWHHLPQSALMAPSPGCTLTCHQGRPRWQSS